MPHVLWNYSCITSRAQRVSLFCFTPDQQVAEVMTQEIQMEEISYAKPCERQKAPPEEFWRGVNSSIRGSSTPVA